MFSPMKPSTNGSTDSNAVDARAIVTAIDRSQATIMFDVDGTIRGANENFLRAIGYSNDEIQGNNHRMFVDDDYARSDEYRALWQRLRSGEFFAARVRRRRKDGSALWLQASYNPIVGPDGTTNAVIKVATDITAQVQAEQQLQRGVAALLAMISETASIAQQLSSTTEELAATARSQSARTEDAATSAHELAQIIQRNAASSQRASDVAVASKEHAEQGLSTVREMTVGIRTLEDAIGSTSQSVERLEHATSQIEQLVHDIEDIADKTHVLALNAAIEAARAGEKGRGFSVVAQEVRTLAQRTRQTTGDIVARIALIQESRQEVVSVMNDSRGQMTQTIAQAGEAGTALDQITAASNETLALIEQIAAGVRTAQENGDQIARTTEMISNSVVESTAATGEVASASTELSGLTSRLRDEVLSLQPSSSEG